MDGACARFQKILVILAVMAVLFAVLRFAPGPESPDFYLTCQRTGRAVLPFLLLGAAAPSVCAHSPGPMSRGK